MLRNLTLFLIKCYISIKEPIMQGLRDQGINASICIFEPTCSEYAKEAVKKYRLSIAFKKVVNRLKRCKRRNKGGYDPL